MKKSALLHVTVRGTFGTIIGVIASFIVGLLIWGLMNIASQITLMGNISAMLFPILIACMSIGAIVGLSIGIQDARDTKEK